MSGIATARRRKSYRLGHSSEALAAWVLRLKGFRVLARRYRTKLGEIDLIARRGDLVLIVEVKARKTLIEAMEAIAHDSERRIEGAADLWLSRQPDYGRLSVRFDMVACCPGAGRCMWRTFSTVETDRNGTHRA